MGDFLYTQATIRTNSLYDCTDLTHTGSCWTGIDRKKLAMGWVVTV